MKIFWICIIFINAALLAINLAGGNYGVCAFNALTMLIGILNYNSKENKNE